MKNKGLPLVIRHVKVYDLFRFLLLLANSCADGYIQEPKRHKQNCVSQVFSGEHLSSNRLAFEILFGIPNSRENKMISSILISRGTQPNLFRDLKRFWDLKNDLAFTQPDV